MAHKYLDNAFTASVQAAQAHYYGRAARVPSAPNDDSLGAAEKEFIEARDSFYLGSVSESGWPYIQHRGGEPGFLRVLDAREHPAEHERLAAPKVRRQVERLFLIDVVGFDWNCPQHITPRYGEQEVRELIEPLQRRVAELEQQLRSR